jgi:hypothetical protein
MPIPERTGSHCSICNGQILRHREWGACWYECESCGCQKSIARLPANSAGIAHTALSAPAGSDSRLARSKEKEAGGSCAQRKSVKRSGGQGHNPQFQAESSRKVSRAGASQ